VWLTFKATDHRFETRGDPISRLAADQCQVRPSGASVMPTRSSAARLVVGSGSQSSSSRQSGGGNLLPTSSPSRHDSTSAYLNLAAIATSFCRCCRGVKLPDQ